MEVLKLEAWPFYQEYCNLSGREQLELLKDTRRRGLTAYRRFRNLIFDLYERLQPESVALHEAYTKIQTHLKLLNEDIDKFNLSYDFGLIAAQMEALDGGREESMSGGLLAPEREELSTRMRFKRQKLTDEQLPPAPVLPPLAEIKGKLDSLDRTHLSTGGLLSVIVWPLLFFPIQAGKPGNGHKSTAAERPTMQKAIRFLALIVIGLCLSGCSSVSTLLSRSTATPIPAHRG